MRQLLSLVLSKLREDEGEEEQVSANGAPLKKNSVSGTERIRMHFWYSDTWNLIRKTYTNWILKMYSEVLHLFIYYCILRHVQSWAVFEMDISPLNTAPVYTVYYTLFIAVSYSKQKLLRLEIIPLVISRFSCGGKLHCQCL